ncbi:fungal hydrophobin [Ganoderma leucocontextum]|nr:fungal hydrophobin [Ganoderma leucocontextum]
MFARLLCVLVAAASVVATTIHRRHHKASACSTGPIQCCDSTATADSPSSSVLLALLGMPLQETTGLIGFNCNPINTGGVSGPSCEQSPGGLISMGCVPVFL